jgi:hypothetical protein
MSERERFIGDLVWGEAIANYVKDLDSKYLEVNAHLPPLQSNPNSSLQFHESLPPALLVRQGYSQIYEEAKKRFLQPGTSRGLVLLGQPGIGGRLPAACQV